MNKKEEKERIRKCEKCVWREKGCATPLCMLPRCRYYSMKDKKREEAAGCGRKTNQPG